MVARSDWSRATANAHIDADEAGVAAAAEEEEEDAWRMATEDEDTVRATDGAAILEYAGSNCALNASISSSDGPSANNQR